MEWNEPEEEDDALLCREGLFEGGPAALYEFLPIINDLIALMGGDLLSVRKNLVTFGLF